MRQAYEARRFQRKTQDIIEKANKIGEEYKSQNLTLTLRQIHYQFVARDWYENTMANYKKLGDILRNARMAGLFDWNLLVDRTRSLYGMSTYDSPAEFIRSVRYQYNQDMWDDQDERVEIWVEKNALRGVIAPAANGLFVDYFPTVGYPSISALKKAAERLAYHDKPTTILMLSDHDPEGFQMTDAIRSTLDQFGADVEVRRIGLTMEQIEQYNPPPSFAKESSSRFDEYVEEQGTNQAWELDALEPRVIQDLIREEVNPFINQDRWDEAEARGQENKQLLRNLVSNWDDVVELLS